MERPRGIGAVAITLAALNTAVLVLGQIYRPEPDNPTWRIYTIVIAAVGYAVIWYFWRRRNWARIVVMLQAGLAILNALMATRVAHEMYLFMMAQAAFGVFLLVWLSRPEVRAWFSRDRR